MSLDDFMAAHPVPPPPAPAPVRDTVAEAFGGRRGRSMTIVDRTVCKVGCQDHEHVGPVFTPDPSLDESGVGWTSQHIPNDTTRHVVPKRCILCWSMTDDLAGHACHVMEAVRG